MKRTFFGTILAVAACATLPAAVPSVTDVAMVQANDRLVTITYTLSNAPAVVTLDVQTNATANAASDDPGWTSIGGEAVWNALGDVWRKVGDGLTSGQSFSGTITWHPDHAWPGHEIVGDKSRAVVTAWPLENTPDYMVVDLIAPHVVRYYPAVDFLPKKSFDQAGAAVTNNPDYKMTKLLMRKIMAKGVTCRLGSSDDETQRTATREALHTASFTNNYYIGVFEVTQAQWANVATNYARAKFTTEPEMRPMETVSYHEVRIKTTPTASTSEIASYSWPSNPAPASFLGRLRAKTGLDFDLPSEAQWEFAARAGHGSGYWNDGSKVLNSDSDGNLKKLARFNGNPSVVGKPQTDTDGTIPPSAGTAIVGSYAPSTWGLYDMHGNVYEMCLDWYLEDMSSLDGRVNIDPQHPDKMLSGAAGSSRAVRGGGWEAPPSKNRASFRFGQSGKTCYLSVGFRVVCTAGLR